MVSAVKNLILNDASLVYGAARSASSGMLDVRGWGSVDPIQFFFRIGKVGLVFRFGAINDREADPAPSFDRLLRERRGD
jgi:hypothetical protein